MIQKAKNRKWYKNGEAKNDTKTRIIKLLQKTKERKCYKIPASEIVTKLMLDQAIKVEVKRR